MRCVLRAARFGARRRAIRRRAFVHLAGRWRKLLVGCRLRHDLDELPLPHRFRVAGATFGDGIRHRRHEQAHGANGVVVAGDDEIHAIRGAVGVHDSDNRDADLAGLGDSNALVVRVHHEQRVRQPAHVLDAAQAALQLVHQAPSLQAFFLGEHVESAVGGLGFQVGQTTNGLADGLVVGERAAQPTLIDERRADTLRLFADHFGGGMLGADEEHLGVPRAELPRLREGVPQQSGGDRQVDDVDLVADAEDVVSHLRVPKPRLVAEMRPRGQHVANADSRHVVLRVGSPHLAATPNPSNPQGRDHPRRCSKRRRCFI